MTSSLLDQLVEYRGIESNYHDAWGRPTSIEPATKSKLLSAMGYPVDEPDLLLKQVQDSSNQTWLSVLNPVQVLRIEEHLKIVVRLPIELVTDDYVAKVSTELGDVFEHPFVPIDGQLANVAHIEDIEFQEYLIDIPMQLPLGYHTLSIVIDDDVLGSMRLIIAPSSCFKPKVLAEGKKVWGLSIQLYCLRSDHNWGIGDFSDLSFLVEKLAKQGAQFVGLNPIHALYPSNADACSPYGPSSRRWLNFIYIDVTSLDGYQQDSTQAIVNDVSFQQQLQNARAADLVDYQLVTKLKLNALEKVFEYQNSQYLSKNTRLNKVFKAFVADGGDSLQTLAVYDALQESLAAQQKPFSGWPVFPTEFSDFHNPAVKTFTKKHAKRVKFFLWLQWQAALQLEMANQVAQKSNMLIGLYRDLAVGVSEGSAEIWGNKELYCTEASVGAPPDILGPLGQNWGLPPMDPEKLFEQQYQPIIEMFDANMRATGALRIDHVMALLRLWWVVKGDDAKKGGYVYYPVDDLLAILALESHRHQSLVIGEDLGTVPDEIRAKLADNGVYSYRVFFFEQAPDGGFFSPSHYPEQSMSTLTTHDMPTLAGYWHCDDLTLGKELGIYPAEDILSTLYASRHHNKQSILDTLHGHHSINDEVGRDVHNVKMSKALNFGMQLHMASGSSALLSLQLEDWLEMDKPVNIPGTFNEYPNWRRKLTRNLQDIFNDSSLNELAANLTEARKHASK
ncbi:4-alpha-glucanotransferase [uncultured Paraglaciecola sp.]|mgnify:FL=1|uniref:4-alpha-glucanotransferase n=1 Tax=uncultured Paraglaciecola sp. TaxID=1765024 RepID=UPI0025F254BA|nr:4-alpha-glucanotransferase [uncultured Paraglaciecola sp.]